MLEPTPARRQTKPLAGPYTPGTLPKDAYDAVIVGAGEGRAARCSSGGGAAAGAAVPATFISADVVMARGRPPAHGIMHGM